MKQSICPSECSNCSHCDGHIGIFRSRQALGCAVFRSLNHVAHSFGLRQHGRCIAWEDTNAVPEKPSKHIYI
jgi:hypothetical protein